MDMGIANSQHCFRSLFCVSTQAAHCNVVGPYAQAGMDMGIVNAQHCIADAYEKIDKELLGFIEDVLLNRCENATERMMEYAATIDAKSKPTAVRKLGAPFDYICTCLFRQLGSC